MNLYTPTHPHLILITGFSGSGKTTSLRYLDPESSVILNIERKRTYFENEKAWREHKSDIPIKNSMQFGVRMDTALSIKDDNPKKVIIADSWTQFDSALIYSCRETKKGYGIYTEHNDTAYEWFEKLKDVTIREKNPKTVIVLARNRIKPIMSLNGDESHVLRVSIEGKQLDNDFIEATFSVILNCEIRRDPKTNKNSHFFKTSGDGTIPAKTPIGMYDQSSELYIPNDITAVLKKLDERGL